MDILRTWLFDYDLAIFSSTLLSTGFVNKVLSKWQTIRTFYPQDSTLWYDHSDDTIHTGVVFVILYFVLAPIVYQAEKYRIGLTSDGSKPSDRQKHRRALRVALGILSCTMISILIIELGKGYVGGLRPSFARACFAPSSPPYTETNPITSDEQCPTLDHKRLHDVRRSFPSGHASLAVSGSVYGQLVFVRLAQSRRISNIAATSFYAFGWLWFLFAAWVSASRIHDSAHHVGDVAVGALVGMWCAVVHFWFVTVRADNDNLSDSQKDG